MVNKGKIIALLPHTLSKMFAYSLKILVASRSLQITCTTRIQYPINIRSTGHSHQLSIIANFCPHFLYGRTQFFVFVLLQSKDDVTLTIFTQTFI